MTKERELLKRWLIDFGKIHPDVELLKETKELLAQPEQESVYQKLSRIEDGVEVEILPSELWQDGYEAGKRSVLLSKQPEQKQEIPYGIGKLLEFAGKNIRSPIKSERDPPHLYLTRKDCIEVGNYLKGLGL